MENIFKNINYRVLLGILLVFGGSLGLLEKFGIIFNASGLFWTIIFGMAGVLFISVFIKNREHWWSIIPGASLIGLAIVIGIPQNLNIFNGLAFLGSMGLGFFMIYIANRNHWWAIIPAGVLITLGAISYFSKYFQGQETGALFFVGLGLTFLLVALLPTGSHRMNWAFIPGSLLLLFGVLLGTPFRNSLDYIWIGALFIGGLSMIWQFFRAKNS